MHISNEVDSELAVREFMKSVFANDGWEIVLGDLRALSGAVRPREADPRETDTIDQRSATECLTVRR